MVGVIPSPLIEINIKLHMALRASFLYSVERYSLVLAYTSQNHTQTSNASGRGWIPQTFDCRLDGGRLLFMFGLDGVEPVSLVSPVVKDGRESDPFCLWSPLLVVFADSFVLLFNARTSIDDARSLIPNPPRKVKLLSHVITDPAIKAAHRQGNNGYGNTE